MKSPNRRALLIALVLICGIDAFATALYWGSRLLVEDALRNSAVKMIRFAEHYAHDSAREESFRRMARLGFFREIFLLDEEENVVFSTDPALQSALGSPRHVLWTDHSELERARGGSAAAGFPYLVDGEYYLRAYMPLDGARWPGDKAILGVQTASPAFLALDRLARVYWAWILLSILLSALIAYFYVRTVREIEQERARAERGERFEMIGRMAATVAHEIRNPLNIMSATIELRKADLERSGGTTARVTETGLLDDLAEEISRMEHVVQDFLDLARERPLSVRRTDLNALVERGVEGEKRRGQASGSNPPEFELRLDPEASAVELDEDRLAQMIGNLARNASDACRSSGSAGRVRVTTLVRANAVEILVEDSGAGIPYDHREKIFEPFMTTKREGSGLGLAVIRNIAARHGGTVEVGESELGGALFRISLPQSRGNAGMGAKDGRTADSDR